MMTPLVLSFLLILAAPLPTVEDPSAAQRAVAEAHVARGSFSEAGEAYIKLASMSGVVRRDELDRAHVNLDSAYLTSNITRHLCRALQVAEMTIAEGGFEDEQEAKFWQDIRDDDVQRLQADARTTGRANCRFLAGGDRKRVAVALLADDEAGPQVPATNVTPAPAGDAGARRTKGERAGHRQRAQTASGAVLVGVGLGSLGLLAGVLDLHRRQAQVMARMNDEATAAGGFTTAGLQQHDDIYEDALRSRHAAIGLGVVSAAALTTGIALLVSRKRATRALAVYPHGGLHGGGATLRLKF
jgi:hypothetical protein